MTGGPAAIDVRGLRISYGGVAVVHGVDLAVAAGEIVSLLGPSGCGKTTTLRAIAGFVRPDAGEIVLLGRDVTAVLPNRRGVGFVFQGYALFPHLSVFDNVAYGLRSRGVSRAAIAERVRRALALVQLGELGQRRPKQLSGGQQQRVAIARALVTEPEVMLLDEPLSNLDAKLRHEMRIELRRMLKAAKVASIFVTHDQEEAIMLSDRIVLMNAGRIEQAGTPRAMYRRPATLFAAAFLGQANFLEGVAAGLGADGMAEVTIGGRVLRGVASGPVRAGMAAVMVVKHERVRPVAPGGAGNVAECAFEGAVFLGAGVQVLCSFAGQRLVGVTPAEMDEVAQQPGQPIWLGWDAMDCLVFPADEAPR